MTALRSALFFLALLLVTPPYAVLALLCAPLPRLLRNRVIAGWTRAIVSLAKPLLGIRYRVEGAGHLPREPAVVLSKHQSAYETLAFNQIFPPQVHVLKRELLWIPFFGWGLALMSPIAIDRSRGIRALREIARRGRIRLDQGFWVIVFPEGTRVAPGKRRRYQPGGAWLAVHAGVPVVPVAHNAGLLWPRYAFMKRAGTVTFRIGPQIPTKGRDPNQVIAEAEAWIEAQQAELCSAGIVDQLELFLKPSRKEDEPARHAVLRGRRVSYRFERRRRRTFAIAVNHDGLRVLAPMRAPLREVDAFLQEKSGWITRKLDEWAARGRPAALLGRTGESLPLFGRTLTVEVLSGDPAVTLSDERILVRTNGDAREILRSWIREQALEAFKARAAHFAGRLDLPPPPVALMDARTRWGSCSARGRIRLAWRLAHLEPALSDYVVAHEVAHLKEMNHSRRFWALVETLYPEHRTARGNLRRAGAALPLL